MTDTHDSDRIEKSAIGPPSALTLDGLREEIVLIATDSLPKLDCDTVRIETVERFDDGAHQITISGEKSEFCPTYGDGDD